MKYLTLIFIWTFLLSCNNNHEIKEDLPKIKNTGYYFPTEGGEHKIKIDSISPLNQLICKLRKNYELYETGKGYWLGYNDLMFSIAIHSDFAINPLLNFIDSTNSKDAKIAGIYTLHLIGINCKIAGRWHEDFVNNKAREALFKLLNNSDKDIQYLIMNLLIRAPVESDVPKLFNILKSSTTDYSAISNGLLAYDLKDRPIHQEIFEDLPKGNIILPHYDKYDKNIVNHKFLQLISKKFPNIIVIEDTLFNYQFDYPIFLTYEGGELPWTVILCCGPKNFIHIGNNYSYYYKNNKIYLCSAKTTKNIWLNWWAGRTKSYKDSLLKSNKKLFDKCN